ncbi:MAG: DNA/RNA non-specific endonuclease [Bacteroidales bacterium]|nr:DNA/RNA non-specific endonuclease [Bacteroidales bacterium]
MKKNLFRIIGLGIAAVAMLASCSKSEEDINPINEDAFQMVVSAGDPSTKTIIDDIGGGKYGVLWQAGDKLAVYEVGNGTVQGRTESTPLASGGATAQFQFAFSGSPSAPYDYTFVYPAAALSLESTKYLVSLPATQTFVANSFDPAADVLISEHIHSESTRPDNINARFVRLGGTARMTIKAPTTTETIQKIIFSTTDVNIAGKFELNPATGELSDAMAEGFKSITLTPASATTFTGEVVVWFRLAEVTLTDNFTVSVTTDKKTYTKTLYLNTLGRQLPFQNSKLTSFGIDLRETGGVDNIRQDVINSAFTGVGSTSYANWSGKKGTATNAIYAGYTATRGSGDIGVTSNNNSGIVVTTSAGIVKSVTITAKAYTSGYTNYLDIYGKNSSYDSASDLFNDSQKGTLIGTLGFADYSTQTLNIDSDYTHIGIRSQGYAIDITEIVINWEGQALPEVTTGASSGITYSSAVLEGSVINASGGIYEAGFYWDTDEASLAALQHPDQAVTTDGFANPSGSFNATLGSLNELTTYYYRAYVLWLNTETNTYEEFRGDIRSFKTATRDYSAAGWLEIPSYTTSGIAGTTPSSLSDLYRVTHKAEMGGREQRNYTLLYDSELYASYWVAYPLCSDHLGSGREDQWGVFDPKVPSDKQVPFADGGYSAQYADNKWYDRGHQIPNADRNGVAEMQTQTYYPTNITPQKGEFNQGVWMRLESAVRTAVHDSDTVYVVTGAAFRKMGGSEEINTIQCGWHQNYMYLKVPNYYWKVLLKVKWNGDKINNACAVGFWMEHRTDLESGNKTYENYTTTVDQIEAWTGFNFFANLPEALQNACENSSDWTAFKNF